jgi:hypothetical protein
LADPTTWRDHVPFAWLEEALCEVASLFALRAMAKTWRTDPPHTNWQAYHTSLAHYWRERDVDAAHQVPGGASFAEWLSERMPELAADPCRREDNTVIARQLLPIFELDRKAWQALRWLHAASKSEDADLVTFMSRWREASPEELHFSLDLIAQVLGADAWSADTHVRRTRFVPTPGLFGALAMDRQQRNAV